MTRAISPCPIRSSVLHQPPTIVQGFALRRDHAVSCRVRRQQIWCNQPVPRHLRDSAVRCACQIVAFNPTSRIQTP